MPRKPSLSRRSVLRGAAGAGAAGLAAGALGAAAGHGAAAQAATAEGPLVVHVRDARTGDIEVFSGTSQTRLRDRDLATRIARAAS